MQDAVRDAFSPLLGATRGSERPSEEEEAFISAERRQRHVLAVIAAHGVLGHNTAVPMPASFSASRIMALIVNEGDPHKPSNEEPSEELLADLRALDQAGLLRHYKESWKVTPAGLIALWSGV